MKRRWQSACESGKMISTVWSSLIPKLLSPAELLHRCGLCLSWTAPICALSNLSHWTRLYAWIRYIFKKQKISQLPLWFWEGITPNFKRFTTLIGGFRINRVIFLLQPEIRYQRYLVRWSYSGVLYFYI